MRNTVTLVAALLVTVAAGGSAPAQTPQPSTDFVVMPWELPPRSGNFPDPRTGLSSLKACGFTVAGFVPPDQVARCKELGLRCIVAVGDKPNDRWTHLTDDQIESRVRKLVAPGTAADPAVLGYFLVDEPGVKEFPALAKAVAWVKKLAPGKLAYINLFPDYATLGAPDLSQLGTASYTEYLERFVKEVRPQLISYDNYRIESSADMKDPNIAGSYFRNLMDVRRVAAEHDLPFWNIATGNEIRKHTPPPSPANLLMQGYTTLAAGGKGMTWYTYYGGSYRYAAVNDDHHPTATWSYLRMVNDQLKVIGGLTQHMKNLNVFFTGPVPGVDTATAPGKFLQSVDFANGPGMVGEFQAEGGGRYALLVNCSLERSVEAKVKLTQGRWADVKTVSPVDAGESMVEGEGVWLTAGAGALLHLP